MFCKWVGCTAVHIAKFIICKDLLLYMVLFSCLTTAANFIYPMTQIIILNIRKIKKKKYYSLSYDAWRSFEYPGALRFKDGAEWNSDVVLIRKLYKQVFHKCNALFICIVTISVLLNYFIKLIAPRGRLCRVY